MHCMGRRLALPGRCTFLPHARLDRTLQPALTRSLFIVLSVRSHADLRGSAVGRAAVAESSGLLPAVHSGRSFLLFAPVDAAAWQYSQSAAVKQSDPLLQASQGSHQVEAKQQAPAAPIQGCLASSAVPCRHQRAPHLSQLCQHRTPHRQQRLDTSCPGKRLPQQQPQRRQYGHRGRQ
jgi:hypothetical protein